MLLICRAKITALLYPVKTGFEILKYCYCRKEIYHHNFNNNKFSLSLIKNVNVVLMKRRIYFSLEVLIIQFILLFVLVSRLSAQFCNFDWNVLRDISVNRKENTTDFYLAISDANKYVCISAPVGLMATGLLTHNKEMKQQALYIGESMLVSTLLTKSLKNIVQRPRPFESDTTFIPAEIVTGYSFPSGHTSEAFSTATALTIAYPKWYVIVPAYLWAAGVGYSRLYLGVHYPTDVIAGALLGAGSAWITYKVNKWIRGKPQTKLANRF